MGVASVVLAIICLVNIGLQIAVIVTVGATFQADTREESPFHYLLGGWIFAIGLLAVCGIVFGVGGLRQRERRHSCATLGLCLNFAIPLGIMFILLIAMTLHSSTDGDMAATQVTQANDDPAPWRSPTSIALQAATVAMAVLVVWYRRRRRRTAKAAVAPVDPDSIACSICRKQIPSTSRFCRRCGAATLA